MQAFLFTEHHKLDLLPLEEVTKEIHNWSLFCSVCTTATLASLKRYPWLFLCSKTKKNLQSSSATNEWRRVEGMGWQVQDHPRQGGVPLRWAGVYVDAAEQDGGPPRLF